MEMVRRSVENSVNRGRSVYKAAGGGVVLWVCGPVGVK